MCMSKTARIFIIAIGIITLLIIGGFVGAQYQEKINGRIQASLQDSSIKLASTEDYKFTSADIAKIEASIYDPGQYVSDRDEQIVEQRKEREAVVKRFMQSPFRVLEVKKNPYGDDYVVMASPRGYRDTSCGGVYTADACFFFLEKNTDNADLKAFTPEFVGIYGGNGTSYDESSLKFVDKDTIQFAVSGGDAGEGVVGQKETMKIHGTENASGK